MSSNKALNRTTPMEILDGIYNMLVDTFYALANFVLFVFEVGLAIVVLTVVGGLLVSWAYKVLLKMFST